MIPKSFGRLGCALLLLCSACGDDDAAAIDAPIGQRDGGADDDAASPEDDSDDEDEPGDPGAAGSRDAPRDAGSEPDPGSEPETDAASPPEQTADASSTPDEPSDAAVVPDGAVEVTDCESLSACCEQLSERRRTACENAVEMADEAACVEIARVACPGAADGGRPTEMPCEEVLECCAGLEGRRQTACEAAAATPAGRACERALEMYCP